MSAYVSVFFVMIGMAAVWIMLEVHGTPGQRNTLNTRKTLHKSLGYLFILIYLAMCGFMIKKTGAFQHELSSRAVAHIGLSLFLAPALGFKLLIARRYRRFFTYLPVLGSFIFAAAFTLSGLTAGHYFLYRSDLNAATGWASGESALDDRLAFDLVNQKCSKCHPLERVLKAKKSRQGWIETVVRMAQKDAPHIRPYQAEQIVLYLSAASHAGQPAAEAAPEALTGKALVNSKCSKCHDLNRVYQVKKDPAWWRQTVGKMIENAEEVGEPDFLTEPEAEEIIKYLANRK